ncbi:MAG: hypothetical protein BroJett003_05830 [Planctomycetota bacterium]|nr:MAG: hypothetical protein BroJett003_05830 [Planctomycetota bacterium]
MANARSAQARGEGAAALPPLIVSYSHKLCDACNIDAEDVSRAFQMTNGEPETLRIEGLSVRNGFASLAAKGGPHSEDILIADTSTTFREWLFASCTTADGESGDAPSAGGDGVARVHVFHVRLRVPNCLDDGLRVRGDASYQWSGRLVIHVAAGASAAGRMSAVQSWSASPRGAGPMVGATGCWNCANEMSAANTDLQWGRSLGAAETARGERARR